MRRRGRRPRPAGRFRPAGRTGPGSHPAGRRPRTRGVEGRKPR